MHVLSIKKYMLFLNSKVLSKVGLIRRYTTSMKSDLQNAIHILSFWKVMIPKLGAFFLISSSLVGGAGHNDL